MTKEKIETAQRLSGRIEHLEKYLGYLQMDGGRLDIFVNHGKQTQQYLEEDDIVISIQQITEERIKERIISLKEEFEEL